MKLCFECKDTEVPLILKSSVAQLNVLNVWKGFFFHLLLVTCIIYHIIHYKIFLKIGDIDKDVFSFIYYCYLMHCTVHLNTAIYLLVASTL